MLWLGISFDITRMKGTLLCLHEGTKEKALAKAKKASTVTTFRVFKVDPPDPKLGNKIESWLRLIGLQGHNLRCVYDALIIALEKEVNR